MEEMRKQVDLFVNKNIDKIESGGHEGISENGEFYIISKGEEGGIKSTVKPANNVESDKEEGNNERD